MKAMILPGNGGSQIQDHWYPFVKKGLTELGLEVIATDMPDPVLARSQFWLPFIEEKAGDNAILIGLSSGAIAALRYAETHPCALLILIGVYHSDLGDESEKQSGYFDAPWDWEAIRNNTGKIVIFASKDDPFIAIEEPQFIKEKLHAEYHEYTDEGHFGVPTPKDRFPEVVTVVEKFLGV